jgi:septum formation protein
MEVMSRRLVLASASVARLRLLQAAGLDPEVVVSGIDESLVTGLQSDELARELAVAKAMAVAGREADALVLGCDSVLDMDGVPYGKPADAAEAVERWHAMRGRSGTLVTGHCVCDSATGMVAEAVIGTLVWFGRPTDEEIEAYVASGEPLGVAGAFTLDGRSAPFIEGVDGDPGNVIGVSLPLVRDLLAEHGVRITDLWR